MENKVYLMTKLLLNKPKKFSKKFIYLILFYHTFFTQTLKLDLKYVKSYF